MKINITVSLSVAALSFAAFAANSSAQESERSADTSAGPLEEITVSVRRRSENLQEIPDSVTVFTTDQIDNARISDIRGFAKLTPNLSSYGNFRPGLARATIRGIASNQLGEPPLAFVVDDVSVSNIEFVNQGLQDIEQIEVLRGAQGALYGKNAIGGAINITTRQPTNEAESKIKVSYAEGNDLQILGSTSGAFVEDQVFYRFSASYQDADGLIDDTFRNEEADYIEAYRLQGMLRFILSDQTSLDIRARYSDGEYGFAYFENVTLDTLDSDSVSPGHNVRPIDENQLTDISVKLDHEIGDGALIFVTSYSKSEDDNFADADFSALAEPFGPTMFGAPPASAQASTLDDETTSFEVRYVSPQDSSYRWVAGALYQDRERVNNFDSVLDFVGNALQTRESLAAAPAIPVVRDEQESESIAVFYQGDVDLSESLGLTFALRYDEEDRDGEDPRVPTSVANETFSELQPKASLSWQASDNLLAYGTYSRGFRSGGFNEVAPGVTRVFQEEISDSFEVGLKSTLLDGALVINMAAFFTQVDDAQFTRLNLATFSLEQLNVDEVDITGFEVEAKYRPFDGLDISLGLGVIDNEIQSLAGAQGIVGNSMPYVADWNANLAVAYTQPMAGDWIFVSQAALSLLGERHFDLANVLADDGATNLDLSVGVENNQWKLLLFATNLTDEAEPQDAQFGITSPAFRFRNKPRQVGVELSYLF